MALSETRQLDLILNLKDQATSSLRSLASRIKEVEKASGSMSSAFSKAGSRFSMEANVIGKAFDVAKYSVIGFGSAVVAAGVFGVRTAGQLEAAEKAFEGLFGSAEEARKTMDRIKKEASETPFELTGLTEGVKQLSSVVSTGDEAIDILLNVGKAVTASGGGQEELSRVVFNLKQIKGMGELNAIDLKELRRAIPIFDKIVEAAGTTVKNIQDAKDPAKALFDAFEKGGKKIEAVDKAFILQAGSFNQLMSNMHDSMTILFSDIVKESGIFDMVKNSLAGMIQWINANKEMLQKYAREAVGFVVAKIKEWIDSMGGPEGIKQKLLEAWDTIKKVGEAIIDFTKFVWEHKELILKLIIAWELLKVALAIHDVFVGLGGVIRLFSSGSLTPLITLLTGPVGLIAAFSILTTIAIVKAIEAWGDLRETQEEIKTSMQQVGDNLDEMEGKINSLSTEKARTEMRKAIDDARDLKKEAEDLANMGFFESVWTGIKESNMNFGRKIGAVNDAIITPQGDVIKTDPSDYLIATKTPGALAGGGSGGVTVVVNYPMVLDRNAGEKLADVLSETLRRKLRI